MNKTLILTLTGLLLAYQLTSAQTQPQPLARVSAVQLPNAGLPGQAPSLTKFDLDFPGGTPGDLVRAIENAWGRPLNAVVPSEYDRRPKNESPPIALPALKMKGVTVPQLFEALQMASVKSVTYTTGFTQSGGGNRQHMLQTFQSNYGFKTQGPVTDDSVWYFYYEKPSLPPEESKLCRFWQLTPYLETYKIEDIITAVDTGCKMMGEPAPTMNFHKDTRLLIAVGADYKLKMIDMVLAELGRELGPVKPGSPASPARR